MSKTQNVFITGASSGLGKQMAKEFASRGYNLALTARREDILIALKSEIEQAFNVKVYVAMLDVQDFTQTQQVLASAAQQLGSIDKVIVNAGIASGSRIGEDDAFNLARDVINTNVIGAIASINAAVQLFRQQGHGHIVAISSVAAYRGLPGTSVYSASKRAISTYTEALRVETHNENIDVTLLSPGYIDTPLNQDVTNRPFLIDLVSGGKILVSLIEKKVKRSMVPSWPWGIVARILTLLPTAIVARAFG